MPIASASAGPSLPPKAPPSEARALADSAASKSAWDGPGRAGGRVVRGTSYGPAQCCTRAMEIDPKCHYARNSFGLAG